MNSHVTLRIPKKIVPSNFVDVVLKHCISLDLKLYGQDTLYCKYCDNVVTGGFYRFICHLTAMENVEACEGVGDEVRKEMLGIYSALQEINEESNEVADVNSKNSKKNSREEACRAVARFIYNNVIPFDVVLSDEFKTMCDLFSVDGGGFKPPSYDEIRGKYLTEEVKLTNEALEEHRATWKITGCSIMIDAWCKGNEDMLKVLVNSPKGTFFLKSIDASDKLESVEELFEMMDDIVEEVGEENVVQIVTDQTLYYKLAAEILMMKRTRLYWTPCVIQCIAVILEKCEEKIPFHEETIEKCQRIAVFMFIRPSLMSLLWHFTNYINIMKIDISPTYSSYLTLCSLHENKRALIRMFTSKEWKSCEFAKPGKWYEDVVLDKEFWKNVKICYKVAHPLLEVFHWVNSVEEPAMGFVYEKMETAIKEIQKNLSKGDRERESFMLLREIIGETWDTYSHSPLHAAGYFLNPQIHYSSGFRNDIKVKLGLLHCITRMVPDPEERSKIATQLEEFDKHANNFDHPIAVITADNEIPPIWWASFADGQPELQNFAIRVLCLTCSSFGGYPLRDAFDKVYSKGLKHTIDKDVAFVMANSKLAKKDEVAEQKHKDNEDVEDSGSDDVELTTDSEDEDEDGDEDEDEDEYED
ncbi:uncharacterized protein LOC131640081 [Vicia villosa]|uniref:uncharacterized protein LOC131640081 n=1 Tax=Vicia villosa TaxID=3911 RepID=UPI00273C686B|nr:uncharacterized protein LOC131640081 [Vicia villosa]